MDSLHLSLPSTLKGFVEGQVAAGRYDSASDYIGDLIRADEARKAGERLDALLLEGLASEELPWSPKQMDSIRAEAMPSL